MKLYSFVFCLMALLIIPGCSNTKEQILAYVDISYETHNYSVSLIGSGAASLKTENTVTGIISLVVEDNEGFEIDRIILNDIFNERDLTIDVPAAIFIDDYNNDGRYDIPIGIIDKETNDESMYAIFSLDVDGKMFRLNVSGYKEADFIYTIKGPLSNQFTKMIGTGQGKSSGLLVGVTKEDIYEPADYIWQETQFTFHKNTPYVITEENLNHLGTSLTVQLIQVAYAKPVTSNDKDFCIYESMYRGRFDIVVVNNSGYELSRLTHDEIFGNKIIGFGGNPVLLFKDYTGNEIQCFALGCHSIEHTDFQYSIICIDGNGELSKLPCTGYGEKGYAYDSSYDGSFKLLEGDEKGFEVTLSDEGWIHGEYKWNGDMFEFYNRSK